MESGNERMESGRKRSGRFVVYSRTESLRFFGCEEARRTGDTKRPGSFFFNPGRDNPGGMSSIRDSYYAVRDELANNPGVWRTSCMLIIYFYVMLQFESIGQYLPKEELQSNKKWQ